VVRLSEPGDLVPLADVDRQVFCELTYPYYVLCQLFDLFQRYCVIAQVDGEVCGYALIGVTPDRDVAWLLGLGVVPAHRNKGLGARLLNDALALCSSPEVDVREVKITVRPTNKEAYHIYEQAKFVEEHFEEAYFGAGEPRRLLHLVLGPARTSPMAHQQGEEQGQRYVSGVAVGD
jgi:ribosomal-protein-alanine N-acetyltransferase